MLDMVILDLKAGNGGNGAVAWRREKYEPAGGPYGGDGGKGGSIILKADKNIRTLLDFKHKRSFKAESGEAGRSKKQYGKNGEDMILKVPVGTIIKDYESKGVIKDLKNDGESYEIVKGGRGGRGNAKFATPTRQAPNFSESGKKGEEKKVILELKLIADASLIGYPNVGKSSILSVISRAKPKIANYHFTTLEPNLGVVSVDISKNFVIADIPGLIEGAHKGLGLGLSFLKHIERTNILVHVLDASCTERKDPYEDFLNINKELFSYNEKLRDKKQVVVLNKADLIYDRKELDSLKEKLNKEGYDTIVTSAATKEGIDELKYKIYNYIEKLPEDYNTFDEVYYMENKKEEEVKTYKLNDIYFIEGDKVENILENVYFDNIDSLRYLQRFLEREGIIDELKNLGISDGDTVDLCGYEFEYFE